MTPSPEHGACRQSSDVRVTTLRSYLTCDESSPEMVDQRMSEWEVVEVTTAAQAHVAAEVLALHVLEQLVGAVEA